MLVFFHTLSPFSAYCYFPTHRPLQNHNTFSPCYSAHLCIFFVLYSLLSVLLFILPLFICCLFILLSLNMLSVFLSTNSILRMSMNMRYTYFVFIIIIVKLSNYKNQSSKTITTFRTQKTSLKAHE